jgi:hypothetical protein
VAVIVMNMLVLADERHPGCVKVERTRTLVRVRARVQARQSDRALASGISPDSSACLSVRAHALIGCPTRAELARAIRRLVHDAGHPVRPMRFAVPICRSKIWRSRELLEGLAERLLSDGPLDARGLAQIRLLLSDGAGPLYDRPTADDLQPALERAIAALEVVAP